MQNINELIGIIKGINFDGVINNKEVVRLQSWVDKNRNLAYDKRQMELIKMVVPIFVPMVFSMYFDVFDGGIQAYVFVFLTSLFMQEKMEG